MSIQKTIENKVKEAFLSLYSIEIPSVEFQATRKEFEGDITVVVFPMLRYKKGNPAQIGAEIGAFVQENVTEITSFNVVKGFLNLVISDSYYLDFFNTIYKNGTYGLVSPNTDEKAVMVEYSSPNTNKPLHLGHVRNNLLGYSVAEIIKASGKKVYKTQIINDRGIHICKSMVAWQKFAPNGSDGQKETPESTGLKGDKLVGNYYVKFDQEYKKELEEIRQINNLKKEAEEYSTSLKEKTYKLPQIADYNKIINTQITKSYTTNNNIWFALGGAALATYFYTKKTGNKTDNKNIANIVSALSLIFTVNSFEEKVNIFNNVIKKNEKQINIFENQIVEKDKYQTQQDLFFKEREQSKLLQEAQEMLRKWESGDAAVVALWKKMNGWVYKGFEVTYKNLGVNFDNLYYESDTYLLGKDVIEEGLQKGVFYKKEDGSVWCDLTDDGLDEKLVLRSDGTAVYMTQDIGTAIQRVKDYTDVGGMVYTVGNEQDYHFQVLFLILKKLGFSWAENLFHLSYGMVDLPSGKMKSREGTVVDADDLMVEMATTAKEISEELGKLDGYSGEEKEALYKTIGLGALKYFILKVDPKKRILFDPKSSVDFQGNTGPFIQYTYARIQSILRKAGFDYTSAGFGFDAISNEVDKPILHEKEKSLLKQLELFPENVQLAATNYSPAIIANYTYDLVKEFNSFYQNVSILGEQDEVKKQFRVQLSNKVAITIKIAFSLLGIQVPERM